MRVQIKTPMRLPFDILNQPAHAPYEHIFSFGKRGDEIWNLWEEQGYTLKCNSESDENGKRYFSEIVVYQNVEIGFLRLLIWYFRKFIPRFRLTTE